MNFFTFKLQIVIEKNRYLNDLLIKVELNFTIYSHLLKPSFYVRYTNVLSFFYHF